MARYLITLLAAFLMMAIGAFFLYVALVPTVIASLILAGLAVMFGLGVYVGTPGEANLGNSFRPSGRGVQ
jgi:hypothetical protein